MKVLAFFFAACIIGGAIAQDIVIFGDSLSDNGNGYAANAKLVLQTDETYPQPPYYEGRWQNGPTWIEVAAQQLGVPLQDYAAAGATTGSAPAQVPPLNPPFGRLTVPTTVLSPNLFQQLNTHFLARNNSLNAQSVYFIFIGGNDFLSTVFQNTSVTPDQVVGFYRTAIQSLYVRGARRFVIVGTPDISGLPAFTNPTLYGSYSSAAVARAVTLIADMDTQLQGIVSNLPSRYPGTTADYFYFGDAFGQIGQNAAAYGITELQIPCYIIQPNLTQNSAPTSQPIGAGGGQLCSNPDAHLFFDQFHPSRVVHEFIGAYFVQQFGQRIFSRGNVAPSSSLTPSRGPSASSGSLPVLRITGK